MNGTIFYGIEKQFSKGELSGEERDKLEELEESTPARLAFFGNVITLYFGLEIEHIGAESTDFDMRSILSNFDRETGKLTEARQKEWEKLELEIPYEYREGVKPDFHIAWRL